MKEDTLLQHPKQVELKPGNRPLISPTYQTVKFTVDKFERLAEPDMFFYGSLGNPTVRELEMQLARLQGREDGVVVSTGCAAIVMPLFALLKTGDHIIYLCESYAPIRYMAKDLLGKFGVESTMVSISDLGAVEKAVRPNTKILIFESPTNPVTHLVDIEAMIQIAHKHKFLTLLDNTFAGILNHRDYDVDLTVHSLTKFISGHGDVMGGVILGKKALLDKIRFEAGKVGTIMDPHVATLVSRGLKTFKLRRERQCQTALTVARWLEKQKTVSRVWYPGLESHPGHALAKKQMADFGGIIAFDLKTLAVPEFFGRLKLFTLAASLGSCESLAAPMQLFYARDLSAELQEKAGIFPGSVRLSIGLEDPADLIADLEQAL